MNLESSKYSDANGYKWDAISKAIEGCDETALSYFKTLDDGNGTINNQSASVEGLSAHLKATGQGFNFAAIKATLLNTALNAGIFLLASLAIQGIAKALDNYIHRVEKARERTDELFDEFKQMNDTLADHKKTVSELADRYDELSKGVNLSNNDNLSLSTDEYEEFLDINEQLANSFPELANGIDENGNSILTLGTKGITAKEQLEELLQTEQDLNNFRIAQGLEEAFKGVYTYVEDANEATEKLNNTIDESNNQIGVLQDYIENGVNLKKDNYLLFQGDNTDKAKTDYVYAMQSAAQEFLDGLDDSRRIYLEQVVGGASGLFTMNTDELTGAFDFYANLSTLEPDEIADLEQLIKDNVVTLNGALLDQISEQKQELQEQVQKGENAWRDFIPNLVSGMKSKQTFKDLDSDLQDIAIQIVSGLDYSYADAMKAYDPDPYAYIRDKFIVPMGELSDDDKQKLQSSFEELLKLDANNLAQSNQAEIEKLITTIATLLEKDPLEIRVALGFDTEDIQNRYNEALKQAKRQLGGYDHDDRGFEVNNSVGNEIDTFWSENVVTEEDWALWQKVTAGIDNATEAMEAYIKAKKEANKVNFVEAINPNLSISETVTQLNTRLKPAIDSLQSAYQDIFADDKFQLNSIDILSTCDAIKSKLDEMADPEGLNLDVDYSAYENFVKVLSNTESTADDVNKAFDFLANSITNAALTGKEDIQTMNAALEDLGLSFVVNNKLVAFQELINNTTALEEAISNAGLTMDDFVVHTEDGSIAATDAAQAFIEEMVGAENCQQALALLQLQHTLCNEDSLNNTDDINACLTLAKAAGVAVESLSWLADVSAQYDAAVAAGDTVAQQNLAATMEAIKKKINDELANFEPTSVDFSGVGKGAKGAGKKAGDAYVDAFEKEYNHLKDMLNRGEISEAQYLNRLRALYTRYFKDRKKYLDEYKKYESEYLSGMLDLHNKALSGISTLLNQKISAANDAKDATVSALQEEKEKAAEVYQSQIDDIEKEKDAIDDLIKEKNKKISSLNEEAEAIRKASEERKRDIELQDAQRRKAQAENQRVELKYSQDKGFYYDVNTEEIRKANEDIAGIQEELQIAELEKQVDLIQKEIDLLEEKKDSLTDEQDRIQKLMDESNKYYDNLIKQQEKMWDSMIRNIEQQKSKWEELANIQEIAEAYSAVQQVFGDLGYTVEDVLNGSDAAFEDFKSRYISLISDVNSNSDFTEGLVYATGVAKENLGSFLDKTKETAEGLDELSGKGSEMDSVAESMDKLSDSATTASTSTGEIASNMGELNTNTQGLSDNLNGIGDALTGIPEADKFDTLATSFTNLGDAIKGVADVLGIGGEGAVSTLVSALQEISKLSLDGAGSGEEGTGSSGKGIISQFNNLKTAVEDVTNAITGGGSSGHMGSDASSSSSPSMSVSAEGEDTSGLINAIEDIKPATDEALVGGEGDGSGAIPQFQELKTAVDDVTAAIGLPDSEGGKGTDSTTLISALRAQYETASETVPETKALFDELLGSITACVNALNSMVSLMSSMPEMGGIGGASVTTHADGTSNNSDATIWTTLADGTRVRDLQPGDKMYDLQQKFNAYLKSIDGNLDKLVPNSVYEHNREMNKLADQISYVSNIVNNNRNLQQPIVNNINVTCPGVTEQQVAERIGSVLDKELDKQFSGFHNYVDQRSRMR